MNYYPYLLDLSKLCAELSTFDVNSITYKLLINAHYIIFYDLFQKERIKNLFNLTIDDSSSSILKSIFNDHPKISQQMFIDLLSKSKINKYIPVCCLGI